MSAGEPHESRGIGSRAVQNVSRFGVLGRLGVEKLASSEPFALMFDAEDGSGMSDRPYVRVYHADLIRDYPEVWDDDAALASWLRLLVTADGSWPAPAELPRSVKARPLSSLTARGLVELSGSHRFSIKGLDAERNARSNAARNAAASRWHSERNAETMPNRAEPNRAKPNRADEGDRDSLDVYYELTSYRPWGIWSGEKIRAAITDYGDSKVTAAMRSEWTTKPDRSDLLDRTFARLARDAERARRERKAEPKPKAPPVDRAAVNAELRKLMVIDKEAS